MVVVHTNTGRADGDIGNQTNHLVLTPEELTSKPGL